jgi:hypothetical protein
MYNKGLFIWDEPARVPDLVRFMRDPTLFRYYFQLNFILRLYGDRAGRSRESKLARITGLARIYINSP